MRNIASAPIESVSPRYDGLYHARPSSDDSTHTIRFYPDGAVVTAWIGGEWDTSRIQKWFDRSHPHVSKGVYAVLGEAICLTSTSRQGRVDYAGFLHKGVLKVSGLSQINGHSSDYLSYDFTPLAELRSGSSR